jgi:hypothetical protein
MKKIFAGIALISMILTSGMVYAQAVSVGDVLQKAGATEGFLYDIKGQRGLNFLAATLFEKGNFQVVGGLVSTDGIGMAVNYDIGKAFKPIEFPILSLVNYLHVGIGGYYRTLTIHTDPVENSKDDNKFGWGPTVFVKWAF